MSVITREEIEDIVDKVFSVPAWSVEDYRQHKRSGMEIGALVAALVEERMKEVVCAECGTTRTRNSLYCVTCGPDPDDTMEIGTVLRAQFEADREG